MTTIYKNPRLKKADNGGYILCFDKHCVSQDAYDGMSYMGEGTETFDDGAAAIKRLDEMHASEKSGEKIIMDAKMKRKEEEEDAD